MNELQQISECFEENGKRLSSSYLAEEGSRICQPKEQRIVFVDLAKGFCITLVVFYHIVGEQSGDIIKMTALFRMPLYFVLSGLFFKTYGGLIPFFKKKVNKLLVPFLFCFFFFVIPTSLFLELKSGEDFSLYNLFWDDCYRLNLGVNVPIWFLICLFFVNIYFYLIYLISRSRIINIIILSCFCGIVGFIMNASHICLPLWLDSALTATPFFMMGYSMRHYGNVLYGKITNKEYIVSGLSLLLLLGLFYYNKSHNIGTINYYHNEYDISIAVVYLGGMVGTYLVLMLSKLLGHVPVVSYIGRYSIVVLITNLIYRFIIRNILYQIGIPQENVFFNLCIFVIVMVLELPTIKYCIRYLPVCFAQKDLWK